MADSVAVTIGTKVSFAWETVHGVRPTTGYQVWCDCTSHPDLNPARDQIETTTLCQENNHTYTSGLRDFGDLEFGANLTQSTLDLFIGENGYATLYGTSAKQDESGNNLGLWVCIDIKAINKSYYIPVKPQDFGMPSGEAGSNKYDLVVYFSVVGDAVWAEDPIYSAETTHTMTITGYVSEGVTLRILKGSEVVKTLTTVDTSTTAVLPAGIYTVIASKDGSDSQVEEGDMSSGNATVTFESFE